jgi:hypothetical protein
MNYENLLRKYMKHVLILEGTTFVELENNVGLTDEELETLEDMARDLE